MLSAIRDYLYDYKWIGLYYPYQGGWARLWFTRPGGPWEEIRTVYTEPGDWLACATSPPLENGE